jgi:hypothetical protein
MPDKSNPLTADLVGTNALFCLWVDWATSAWSFDSPVHYLQCIAFCWVASLSKMGFKSTCEAQPAKINIEDA